MKKKGVPGKYLQYFILPDFILLFFDSYSSIFFIQNRLVGLLIFFLSFLNLNIGIYGFFSVVIGMIFDRFLFRTGKNTLRTVLVMNCLLTGLFQGALYQINLKGLGLLLAFCTNTFFTFLILSSFFSPLALPVLSLPFSISASLFIVWMPRLAPLQWSDPSPFKLEPPLLTELFAHFPTLTASLKSLSSILFISDGILGTILIVALLIYSRIQVLAIGLTLTVSGILNSFFFQPSSNDFLYWLNFNFILFGLSLGGYFLVPKRASFFLLVPASLFCFFIYQYFLTLWGTHPEWIHSFPYCFCCLMTLIVCRRYFPSLLNPYLGQSPEKSLDLLETRRLRFGFNEVVLQIPFDETVTIIQGFNGDWTHQGPWQYALDFAIRDSHQRSFQNQGTICDDYYIYGKKILSPCAGTVEKIENSREDRKIGFIDHNLNWGNFILIRMDSGLYVLLAHLKKGSIQVNLGQMIHPGQPLGEVGNSGYSLEPHLHLHVQKNPQIGSETLPFRFQSYRFNQRQIAFYETPRVNQTLSKLKESRTLQYAFDFRPGQKLTFERLQKSSSPFSKEINPGLNSRVPEARVRGWAPILGTGGIHSALKDGVSLPSVKQELEQFTLRVELDELQGHWILRDEKKGRLFFWKDSTHFYFYDLICDEESPLKDFMAAIPILPLTFGQEYFWKDYLPLGVRPKGFHRFFQELGLFFGLFRRRRDILLKMGPDGMTLSGRIFYFNRKLKTQIQFDPLLGLQEIQVGDRHWRRVNLKVEE